MLFFKAVESTKPYYPEPFVSRIMDIKLFYDIRDKNPDVLRKINFELIVIDSGMFKPFKYYRYNPKTNELEEINLNRLTKNNYEDDLFELQKTRKVKVDEHTEIGYSQHNYNEDLWKAVKEKEDLEEEIGCPLDVVFRLKEQGYFCDFKGRHYEIKSIEFEQHTLPYIEFWINKNYEETSIELLKHYKKTWWLREDMSE